MALSGTATITAKTGPGDSVTALVLNNVTNLNFDLEREVLVVEQGSISKEFDLDNTATVTITISGSVYTITVSS